MFKWQRVGGMPIQMVGTSVFTAIGGAATLGILFMVVRGLIRGTFESSAWPGVLFVLLFLTAWTAAAYRMGRVGVFVSDIGVRNRSMFRTRTIPWADVKRFETRPMVNSVVGSFASMLRANAVWILLTNGTELQTGLAFREKTGFLPPSRVTKFGDVVAGPAFSLGEQAGMTLSDQGAQRALRELRAAQQKWSR
jgi:hypothetical protein